MWESVYQGIQSQSESDHYLVVAGDVVLTTADLRRFISQVGEAEATALVNRLNKEDPSNWICAGVNNDHITGIEGHPRGGSFRLCGIYGFCRSAIDYIRRNPGIATPVPVGGMPPTEADKATPWLLPPFGVLVNIFIT